MQSLDINSTADKIYFSRVVNLIGSVRKNHSRNSSICVWDKGMTPIQVFILRLLNVRVIKIEPFISHWKECYSWKFYVYKYGMGDVFLHLDAGNTVLGNLDMVADAISREAYFLIDQGQTIADVSPVDMIKRLNSGVNIDSVVFAAGNIGLKKSNYLVQKMIDELYAAAIAGECLGYSEREMWRDTLGLNIVRNCKLFRHDQTVLNLIFRKYFEDPQINSHKMYAALDTINAPTILNNRTWAYSHIRYAPSSMLAGLILLFYCQFADLFYRVSRYLIRWRKS